jgi:predicted flap endonuclease-1-like 5' DNA nuclease
MMELFEANWPAFVAVLLLGLLVAWWIWGHRPAERVRTETPDVLTPGAAPAERNTLLVEAPPATAAVVVPPPVSIGMAGIGEVIAAAATREIADPDAAMAAPPPVLPAEGAPDDLTRIKGVGPKLTAMLTQLGVTRYDQIAAWSPEDAATIDQHLGPFQGRIARDNWIEQCRYLAAGDTAGFETKFGKV